MKINTCLLVLLIALILLVDHYCYGDYFNGSECTPNDVMNNCNSTDCMPGVLDADDEDDRRCVVFWEGDDLPISFRVCRKKTNGTVSVSYECRLANLADAVNPVKCKNKKYRICSSNPPSGGSGCANFVCQCELPSDGTNDPEANQSCTD